MRDIDFTPDWYLESLAQRSGVRHRVACCLVLAGLFAVWLYDSSARTQAASAELQRLRQSDAAQSAMVERLEALEEENARLAKDGRLLAEVRGGVPMADLLAELSHLMPHSMNLRLVSFTRPARFPPAGVPDEPAGSVYSASEASAMSPASPASAMSPASLASAMSPAAPAASAASAGSATTLEIAGWAASGAEIGSFLSRLTASPLFTDVVLRYQRPAWVEEVEVVEFLMVCRMPAFE